MGMLESAGSAAVSFGTEYVLNKAEAAINEHLIVPKLDRKTNEEIARLLLEKYGNETFYNDLDLFITQNDVVALLTAALRGESQVQPISRDAFVEQNIERFFNANPKYSGKPVVVSRVSDAFRQIYEKVRESTLGISPYTDYGRLQRDLRCETAGISGDTAEIKGEMAEMRRMLGALCEQVRSPQMFSITGISETADAELNECAPSVDNIKQQIKSIEDEFQHKGLFNKALDQYVEILQNIALTLLGQPQRQVDSLLCTLNCNIALCHSNLGNSEKAISSLKKIPNSAAKQSKIYHYVFAIVLIQENNPLHYSDALGHVNSALAIDENYHRAFMAKQHLRELLGEAPAETIIRDLDEYFQPLLDCLEQEKIAEYHLYRGIINLHADRYEQAIGDFENALENKYDEMVGKLNLAMAKYQFAIDGIPRDQRVLLPTIKMKPMLEAESILIEIIKILKGNQDAIAIMRHAIGIYVSACTLIGKPHQLSPISDYIYDGQDYESRRAIIMGSSKPLTESDIGLLQPEDALFCTTREMLRANRVQECKQDIVSLVERSDPSLSPPVFNSLLQACLYLNLPNEYWQYRVLAERNGIDGDLLRSYDAWAYDLEGKTEMAKAIADDIAMSSFDDGLLFNALQFYGRNNLLKEQEALLLRMHELQTTQQIYIVDLDAFYKRLTDFYVSQKKDGFEKLLSEFPEAKLTRSSYLRMQGKYFSEINDLGRMIKCLTELWQIEETFAHGFDLAICLYRAMRYEEAIAFCLKLEEITPAEEKVKLYWLLSDNYLLSGEKEKSFDWAKKAHELMIQNPHDRSHQAYFSRAMTCGHQEVLSTILEYKHKHPVVVDWFHEFSIPKEGTNFAEEFKKKLEEVSPQQQDYEEHQKTIEKLYRAGNVPINLLFKNFHHRLYELSAFATACKLNVASGSLTELDGDIPAELVTDAQTLLIAATFGGLEAIKKVPCLFVNYGSILELQNAYFINGSVCLEKLLFWLRSASNVYLVSDGFINSESLVATAFSNNFVSCCKICLDKKIPYLCGDYVASKAQKYAEVGVPGDIKFISIPAACFGKLNDEPDILARELYGLLKYCTFVSFTSDTIVRTIETNRDKPIVETLAPFMCCTSTCDMISFAKVYIGAIQRFAGTNPDIALQLTRIVLENAKQIWKRGTYARMAFEKYVDIASGVKSKAIEQYVKVIVQGIRRIYDDVPGEILPLLDDVEECASQV